MDILEPSRIPSFWKEFQNKLIEGVPLRELHRDIALKMASLLAEVEKILDAISPNQRNLRNKKLRAHIRLLHREVKAARGLSKYLELTRRDRSRIEPQSERFAYVLEQLTTWAIDCLRKTGQDAYSIHNWAMHYRQQLDEKLESVCKAANKL
jgi:hypothetical protein